MTVKYEDVRAISLTVGEMLNLNCALYDAVRYNENGGYPNTAKEVQRLVNRIDEQTKQWIEEADAFVTANLVKSA